MLSTKSATITWLEEAVTYLNKASSELEGYPRLHEEYMEIENTAEKLEKFQKHIKSLDFEYCMKLKRK